ncbi:GerMN domain-containing protein [Lachnospiraceae bacterium ZAX-1]
MRAKRTCCLFLMVLLLVFLPVFLIGCGGNSQQDTEFHIFYLNKEKTRILPVAYEPETDETEGLIQELIENLSQAPDGVDYKKPMPKEVELITWTLVNHQLYLYFNSDYMNMDSITEVLCRAAIVRTLAQIPHVSGISFFAGDLPLMDKNNNPIGLMTADSFIENPGEQINAIHTATITLYFSNKEGTKLLPEIQEEVHYNSNISMEKLVMERLLKGPTVNDKISALPAETKLVSVSVLDGVCFVNLDDGFLNQNYEISEGVVIYSIVNSLAELSNVSKVQISVNGDTSITYRDKFSFDTLFERNLDYISSGEETEEEDGEIKEIQLEEINGGV